MCTPRVRRPDRTRPEACLCSTAPGASVGGLDHGAGLVAGAAGMGRRSRLVHGRKPRLRDDDDMMTANVHRACTRPGAVLSTPHVFIRGPSRLPCEVGADILILQVGLPRLMPGGRGRAWTGHAWTPQWKKWDARGGPGALSSAPAVSAPPQRQPWHVRDRPADAWSHMSSQLGP